MIRRILFLLPFPIVLYCIFLGVRQNAPTAESPDYDRAAFEAMRAAEPETVRVWPGQTNHFLSSPNLVVIGIPEPPPCYHSYEVDVRCSLCGETLHIFQTHGTRVELVNGQSDPKGAR